MKITIIKNDKFVRVDDLSLVVPTLDVSSLASNWHALQWEGSANGKIGIGEIEYEETIDTPRTNVPISDIGPYMIYITEARNYANSIAQTK